MRGVVVPDELDRRILAALASDVRASHRELARRVDSTAPTVALRIRRMQETGLIEGFRLVTRRSLKEVPLASAPSDWRCVECHGPMPRQAWTRSLGGRHYAFCCRGCEATFSTRFEKRAAAAR
jgi:DNA-binding Lrp family transcriptional regulator